MPCEQPLQEAPLFASALRALNLPLQAWAAQQLPLLGPTGDGEEDPSLQLAEVMDRSLHYLLSRATLGLSPMALAEAYFDWLIHLSLSPGKQLQLWHKGVRKSVRLAAHLARCAARVGAGEEPCISPLPQDKRFSNPEWQQWPFNRHPPDVPAAAAVVAQRGDWACAASRLTMSECSSSRSVRCSTSSPRRTSS